MLKLSAFYFSGTGNTKYVASYLIGKLSGEFDTALYDITEKEDFSREIKEAEIVLIAFPIYGSSPPIPMRRFIYRHRPLFNGKNVAIAETQYFFSGDGSASLGRALERMGANVNYSEHFNMPNNISDGAVFKVRNGSDLDKTLEKARKKMDVFALNIIEGKRHRRGFGLVAHAVGYFGQRKWWRKGEASKRASLTVDPKKCVGCGLCVKSCPVGNLTLTAYKASGLGKCVFCYRCINLCPKGAITVLGSEIKTIYKGLPKR